MSGCDILEVQGELLDELLAEAVPPGGERRAQARATFFRPVIVTQDKGKRPCEISCFSRDISSGGIGLLHSERLELGPAAVKIPRGQGGHVELPCEIVWCHACGEGWFVAGCRFVFPGPAQ